MFRAASGLSGETRTSRPAGLCARAASHCGSGYDPSVKIARASGRGRSSTRTNRRDVGRVPPEHLDCLLLVYQTRSSQRYGLRGHRRIGVLLPGRVITDDHRPRGRTTFREGSPVCKDASLLFFYSIYVGIGQTDARTVQLAQPTLQTYCMVAETTREMVQLRENPTPRVGAASRQPSHGCDLLCEDGTRRGRLIKATRDGPSKLSVSSIHAARFPPPPSVRDIT
jgi:hypothetical protein